MFLVEDQHELTWKAKNDSYTLHIVRVSTKRESVATRKVGQGWEKAVQLAVAKGLNKRTKFPYAEVFGVICKKKLLLL
jgi:hypothetical protein